jgi:hypothetical protein
VLNTSNLTHADSKKLEARMKKAHSFYSFMRLFCVRMKQILVYSSTNTSFSSADPCLQHVVRLLKNKADLFQLRFGEKVLRLRHRMEMEAEGIEYSRSEIEARDDDDYIW